MAGLTPEEKAHRRNLGQIVGNPEQALLIGSRAFAAPSATAEQRAEILQGMARAATDLQSRSPARAFATAARVVELAGALPDGEARVNLKKSSLKTMGAAARATADAGNSSIGQNMLEKAHQSANQAGFGYQTSVAAGYHPAAGQPGGNGRRDYAALNAAMDQLAGEQQVGRGGAQPGSDRPAGVNTISAPETNSFAAQPETRSTLSAVGDRPHAAQKAPPGRFGRFVVGVVTAGVLAALAYGAIVAGGQWVEDRQKAKNYNAMREHSMRLAESAARPIAQASADAQRAAGVDSAGKELRQGLEAVQKANPKAFADVAKQIADKATFKAGMKNLRALAPQLNQKMDQYAAGEMDLEGKPDVARGEGRIGSMAITVQKMAENQAAAARLQNAPGM